MCKTSRPCWSPLHPLKIVVIGLLKMLFRFIGHLKFPAHLKHLWHKRMRQIFSLLLILGWLSRICFGSYFVTRLYSCTVQQDPALALLVNSEMWTFLFPTVWVMWDSNFSFWIEIIYANELYCILVTPMGNCFSHAYRKPSDGSIKISVLEGK